MDYPRSGCRLVFTGRNRPKRKDFHLTSEMTFLVLMTSAGMIDLCRTRFRHFLFTTKCPARLSRNQTKIVERSPSYISPVAGERGEGASPYFVSSISSNDECRQKFAQATKTFNYGNTKDTKVGQSQEKPDGISESFPLPSCSS